MTRPYRSANKKWKPGFLKYIKNPLFIKAKTNCYRWSPSEYKKFLKETAFFHLNLVFGGNDGGFLKYTRVE